MAITQEFINAVDSKNILRVRIMLKDSLLVDKRFHLFNEMKAYAESKELNIWNEKTEDINMINKKAWNKDLMNLELTKLVNDFTKERLVYCQHIIQSVYAATTNSSYAISQCRKYVQKTTKDKQNSNLEKQHRRNVNKEDYDIIIRNAKNINGILKNNNIDGCREWKYEDIDRINQAANAISNACDNISRRKKRCL